MSTSHGITGRTTDDAFQEQRFVWERGALIGEDYGLVNFQDILHSQHHLTHRRKVSKVGSEKLLKPLNQFSNY